jgi:hypothetical protein
MKVQVIYWLAFFLTIFFIGYALAYFMVASVALKVEETDYSKPVLKVKPNYGSQTKDHYKVQGTL